MTAEEEFNKIKDMWEAIQLDNPALSPFECFAAGIGTGKVIAVLYPCQATADVMGHVLGRHDKGDACP